jgi:prephenate dehydrogenase
MEITVIGVRLIGGSLALRLKETKFASKVYGVDKNEENLKKAISLGIIDEATDLETAIKKSKLIVLAIPVDAIKSLLPSIIDQVSDQQVVVELGSTKEQLLEGVNKHPKRGRLVASHPMAGTEYSGPEAAFKDLFLDKTMVLCDVKSSDEDALDLVEALCEALEMNIIFMNPKEHDLHTAYVSHISHITSFALALTVLEKEKSQGRIFELAAGGFESTVRLAKSSPEMWVPIFAQNRTNILEVLTEHIKQLQNMHDVLSNEDYEGFNKLIKRSNKIRRIIK